MRISDWSSDVCSSDLAALMFADQILNAQRSSRLQYEGFGFFKLHTQHHDGIVGLELTESRRNDRLVWEPDVHVDPLEQIDRAAHYLEVIKDKQSWARSEEHTPELQSLMRN